MFKFIIYFFTRVINYIFDKHLKQDKMKLLDRLKTEYSQKLEANNINYPALVARVCNELDSIEYVFELKWGVWVDLKFFTNVDSPYDLFDEIK